MLSCVQLFATPWTVVHQAPLSMGFPSKNTGVGCHFLLQGIFLTQRSNPGLTQCRQILYRLSHQGSLRDSCSVLSDSLSENEVTQLCPTLCDPMDCSPPGPSIHGILQARNWSGLPFPSPGNLPDPGIKPTPPALLRHQGTPSNCNSTTFSPT